MATELLSLEEQLSVKSEPVELPLSQGTLNVLVGDLAQERLDQFVILSQGASQKSVGDISSTLSISCFEQKHLVKNTPWIYSNALVRLFMRPMEKIPIQFRCEGKYDSRMMLSISVRFEDAQFQGMPVEVCPNHLQQNINNKLPHPHHMIQYRGDRRSQYLSPPMSEHFTVKIPVQPEAFSAGQTEFFQMSCLSSCVKVARRQIQIHAELLFSDQILSTVSVPVKISASPLRDKQSCEAKIQVNENSLETELEPPEKRRKNEENIPSATQLTEVLVRVKGRKNCEELKKWLAANVSTNHFAVYSQNR